ncbi:MAG: hypothetical protein LBP83_04495 [Dysgonamonadaceae bacterium]|jgi:hypothetical protein|nr:hypothetical protein [Dysgonamonadaceae bacterium]
MKNLIYMKSHQDNSKTFEELTYAEQAKSISAQILSLEKSIKAHERRAVDEDRDVTKKHAMLIVQVLKMLERVMIVSACLTMTILFTNCKSQKTLAEKGTVEVVVPFSDKAYRSDKDAFRASQSGSSPDLSTAKKIALLNAKAELAGNIQSVVKAVTENYTNQRTVGDKQVFENAFEENARVIVNQMLNDVRIKDEKVFKEKDGKYMCYIAVEMSKESIENAFADKISKDSKLQLDFDRFQFRKIFDEEMEKFEKERGN